MQRTIILFLLFISVYHVLHTFFTFGMAWIHPTVFSILKDVLWLLIVGCFVRKYLAWWRYFLATWKNLVFVFCLLIVWSLALSRWQDMSLWSIVVWFKYDIYPLFVLLSAIGIGTVMSNQSWVISHWSWVMSQQTVMKYLLCILGWGLLRQIAKLYVPEFFSWFGYGSVGDYSLWVAPPMYYRTGPGWMMRLQWLFSWPNNYGFFLVGSSAIVMHLVWTMKKQRQSRLLALLFALSLLWTLSRGAWIAAVAVWSLYAAFSLWYSAVKYYVRQYRWRLLALCLLMLWALGRFSSVKAGSTSLHRLALLEWLQAFRAQPRGYGLGMAWPSVHYEGVYLPENQYLQIILDIGLPGLVLWGYIWWEIVSKALHISRKKDAIDTNLGVPYMFLLLLGIMWLMLEALFLHVREDSMVNYLILLPFGLLLGSHTRRS